MLVFYRNIVVFALFLSALCGAIIYFGLTLFHSKTSLLPNSESPLPWAIRTVPGPTDTKTAVFAKPNDSELAFEVFLDPEETNPYASYSVNFTDNQAPTEFGDLTPYVGVSFEIKCEPKNILIFTVFTFDDRVTQPGNAPVYRRSDKFFTCDKNKSEVSILFEELYTPDWWLEYNGFDLTDREQHLNKTLGFAFINTLQSPTGSLYQVNISELHLLGEEKHYLYVPIALCILLWAAYIILVVKYYLSIRVDDIKQRLKQDMPFVAYQKLTISPQKDKEKSAVLRYMATEYADPEINLDTVVSKLGFNRNKINELLKDELGLTFSAYLNKLRLTEAARLMLENEDSSVAEIAYAVGYNNVTYFNKLFKSEYGCPPKTFKSLKLSVPKSSNSIED